jgi:2-oxoisovalerate dehydrogenase E2 component (dihydrolipoyl transacylase)
MKITMPQLGETVTEGTVAQWLKKVGDQIEKYESFVEVTTDKVNAEVPSPVSGVLTEIIAKEGETVPIGALIAVIDEAAVTGATSEQAAPASAARAPAAVSTPNAPARAASPVAPAPQRATPSRNGGAVNPPELLRGVSPAVRRLAREHHVDLAALHGTGANGRITADDVIGAAHEGPSAAAPAQVPSRAAHSDGEHALIPAEPISIGKSTYSAPVPGTTIPLSQARKIIAQRMVESKHTAPHAWTMVEVDVSNLWKWRAGEKERFQREKGYPLTLLPFFIHAVVDALKAFPLMNARFTEQGIAVLKEIHVGLAVALDSNLIVPVIRDADNLSISGLAIAAGKLIERARSGKLGADDLAGGTFTVNNTGANGSILSAPILNGGQAGIVTMEAVVKRPIVVEGDAIGIRSMMNVCLSLDHRVVDGAIASAFLVDLKKRLEAMGPTGAL